IIPLTSLRPRMSGKQEDLPKYVLRFDKSGPIDFYVCELCKARITPSNWDYHLKTLHPEVWKK
ncbi:MAG: hypothetical protein ACHQ1H_14825, partial [Nitrososphaerales archaeon]